MICIITSKIYHCFLSNIPHKNSLHVQSLSLLHFALRPPLPTLSESQLRLTWNKRETIFLSYAFEKSWEGLIARGGSETPNATRREGANDKQVGNHVTLKMAVKTRRSNGVMSSRRLLSENKFTYSWSWSQLSSGWSVLICKVSAHGILILYALRLPGCELIWGKRAFFSYGCGVFSEKRGGKCCV